MTGFWGFGEIFELHVFGKILRVVKFFAVGPHLGKFLGSASCLKLTIFCPVLLAVRSLILASDSIQCIAYMNVYSCTMTRKQANIIKTKTEQIFPHSIVNF